MTTLIPAPFRSLPVLLLLGSAAAQNPFEWQKRASEVSYGSVPVGKHSLAELPVGQSWRLGANQATVWKLALPVIAGETVLPPGDYVVELQRTGETAAAIVANGSGQVTGGSDLRVEGAIGKASKPGKKLVIEHQKDGAAKLGNQPAKLLVQFGENEWSGALQFPGHKQSTVSGWKVAVWSLPAALVAGRDKGMVPVAMLSKGEQSFNLLLGKAEAKLVPLLAAPQGRGAAAKVDDAAVVVGTAEAVETKVEAEKATLECAAASGSKGELQLDFVFGKEGLRVKIAEPKPAKPGK